MELGTRFFALHKITFYCRKLALEVAAVARKQDF